MPTYYLSIYHKTFKGTLTIPLVSVSFLSVGGEKLKEMEEILKDLQKYEEPKFGSFKWLSCQAGLQKVSKLIEEDKDIKEALHNLIAMSVQSALVNER